MTIVDHITPILNVTGLEESFARFQKATYLDFIRSVMADVKNEFESHEITLSSAELVVSGEVAYDRGTFVHRLRRNGSEQSGDGLEELA